LLSLAFLAGVVTVQAQNSVTTNRYDNARTGQNTQEIILTPQNINSSQFGIIFTHPVDGNVYGQPLYVPNLTIPGQGSHNVVFVVTEGDSVYAFDADSNTGANANPLWHASMIDSAHGAAPGATTVDSGNDAACRDLVPQIGITSTPVIDLTTNTIYVEAKSKENGGFVQRLHALDITTGAEKFSGPAVIAATVAGTGDGSSGGLLTFNALRQHNRPGLLLSNGTIYIAFASHCDNPPYHGWLFAYDAATLAQKSVFVTSPNGTQAGIWMSGIGPAADAAGNVFLTTGNGTFDNSGTELGDSILKFTLSGGAIALADYFTPHDQSTKNNNDDDLGSTGVVLLPDQTGAHTHLMVAGPGKSTTPLYLLDRDHLVGNGPHFCNGCSSDTQIVQEVSNPVADKMWSSPAYWNNTIYLWATNDTLKAFSLTNGVLSGAPTFSSSDIYAFPGSNLTVSSDGSNNGIVWSVQPPNKFLISTQSVSLKAHDATNLSLLFSTDDNRNICPADTNGPVKFSVPTVANGKVYLGTSGALQVYGFPPQATPSCGRLGFIGQFSCDPNGGHAGPCDTGTISVTVGPTTETIHYDGLGSQTGTGYNNGNPGIPQTVAQAIADAFNNDAGSVVNAAALQDGVQFASKQSGATVNFPASITVTSDYNNFSQFGTEPVPFQWSWTPYYATGGNDPNTFSQITPLTGKLQGGMGPATGAVVSLAPPSLVFSNQLVGTNSVAQTITLVNNATATATLAISSITASGDFSQTNNCPSSLAVSMSCTINVTFRPTAMGTRNGTMSVTDNASDSPQTASLRGTGIAPVASLSPTSLSFGNQMVGTTSAAQVVTLTNTGTASLSIASIATSGDFAQINNCPSTLAVNVNCTINVTFTPTATSTRNGTLSVTDNASGSPQTVSLGGTGIAPLVKLLPSSLYFGNQAVGTASAARAVTMTNTGTASLSISGIAISGDFAQANNCASALAVNASCTINVTFAPTAKGARTGTLSVTDNASGSPQTVSLSGTGLAPIVSLSPTSVSFGNQAVGTTSAAQPVTLTNTGSSSLSISGLTASGDFAQTNNCTSALAVNASCTINVSFTPAASGTRTGTLSVTDNASSSPQAVSLIGAGGSSGPAINSLSPAAGPIGALAAISGAGFGTTQGSSTVTFNGTIAQATWGANSISAAAPLGATSGQVVVKVGGLSSNGAAFALQEDALHIFGVNCANCGNQVSNFTIQGSSLYGYVIRPGDILYFYQTQSSGSVGGIVLCFANGNALCDNDGKTVDQDGQRIYADTVQGLTHFRKVDLTPSVGLTLSQIAFTSSGATQAGRWDVLYSAVQIVSADGTVRPIFTTGSSPSLFPFGTAGVTQRGSTIDHGHVW
jgi:hypothetical protein